MFHNRIIMIKNIANVQKSLFIDLNKPLPIGLNSSHTTVEHA